MIVKSEPGPLRQTLIERNDQLKRNTKAIDYLTIDTDDHYLISMRLAVGQTPDGLLSVFDQNFSRNLKLPSAENQSGFSLPSAHLGADWWSRVQPQGTDQTIVEAANAVGDVRGEGSGIDPGGDVCPLGFAGGNPNWEESLPKHITR